MAVTRPSRYPIVAQTPGGNYAEPGSGVQLGGWQTGAIFPSADANWLMRQITDWGRSLDASRLASTDLLSVTTTWRASTTPLAITPGAGLTATIATGGVYYGADGQRLDLTDAPTVYSGGSALVFPNAATRYVIARPMPATGGAVSGSSTAELAVSASAVVAGWATILQVTTAGGDITASVEYSSVSTVAHVRPSVTFDAPLTIDAATLIRGDIADAALTIEQEGTASALRVYNTSSTAPLIDLIAFQATGVRIAAGSGLALDIAGGTNNPGAQIQAGAGQRAALLVPSATSPSTLRVDSGELTTYALEAGAFTGFGGDSGGVYARGNGTGAGLLAESGAGAGGYALKATARNSTSQGAIFSQTHTTATSASRAGYFEGRDQAPGLEAVSAANYPLILTPDVSSPVYGHIYATPQNAAPSNPGSGSLAYVAGTINGWGQGSATDGAFRWLHHSPGGYAYGGSYQNSVTSTSAASYSNLALVDLIGDNAPKVAGAKVRISVKLRFRTNTSGTATGVDIRVIDFTADPGATSPIILFEGNGTGTTSGLYLSGVVTNYNETFSFEFDYTIPAAGDRDFILQIRRWGAISVTGHGSITIDGV